MSDECGGTVAVIASVFVSLLSAVVMVIMVVTAAVAPSKWTLPLE